MRSLLGRLKEGHWPVFLMSMLSALVNLFLPTILVRLLPVDQIGVYKIFFLYVQSMTFLSLAGAPLYSVYYWVGKKENSKEYVDQAFKLTIILGLLATIVGLIFVGPLSHAIALNSFQTVLLLLSAITAAPAAMVGEYLVAKGQRIKGSIFNSGFELIKGAVIVAAVVIKSNIDGAFWAYTILFFIKFAWAIIWGNRLGIFDFHIDKKILKEVWRYARPMSFAGVLSFFLEKVDMLILSSRLSTTEFAYYSMGCLMIPPLLLLEMSVQKVLIPELSRSFHKNDFHSMAISYRKAQSDLAYLIIPSVFGLIIFAEPIVEILFTRQYMASVPVLKIFALTYLSYIFPHDAVARASGETMWVLKIYTVISPLTILTVGYVAGPYGAMGALIASSLFRFAPKIPGLLLAKRITNIPVRKLIAWRALLFYTAVNIPLTVLCYVLRDQFETVKGWFLTLSPIYAVIYLSIVLSVKSVWDKKKEV